ncbi:MAG: hypothetical protein K2Z81_27890 [Cyanobacteria bacterium]|nr:hypothetical protein [Cyanobacteriota bacterium]
MAGLKDVWSAKSATRKRSVTLSVVLLSLSAAITVSACSQEKSMTFKSAGMTHTIAEGPDSLSADLRNFVYPSAVVAGSTSASDEDGEHARFLSLSSTDDLAKVSSWYEKSLKDGGWTIDSTEKTDRLINISGHANKEEINVLMAEDGKKTTISVSKGKAFSDAVDEEELERFTPQVLTPPAD